MDFSQINFLLVHTEVLPSDPPINFVLLCRWNRWHPQPNGQISRTAKAPVVKKKKNNMGGMHPAVLSADKSNNVAAVSY